MKIEYDAEANAIYITLREAEIADTREVTDDLSVDFDEEGRPIGIEILSAREVLSADGLTRVTIENLLPEPAAST